jgi:hypothetical protein
MKRLPAKYVTRRASVFGVAVLVLAAIAWPLVFTGSGFSGDWMNHLWRMWHESRSIGAGDFPSLFLNSSYSVFDPVFAFYGGTLYAVGGLLSVALGGAPAQAYVLMYLLAFSAALGGWYWLGRMCGLGRWLGLVPGVVFVTSAYYIVLVYARGDWPEFTGVSMIPLMLAASLSVLRADRLRVAPAAALAASGILFFGSHNITILLGLTTIALTVLAILLAVPEARRQLTRAGIARLAAVLVPAALVSSWYLLPTVAYASRTQIGSEYDVAQVTLRFWAELTSFAHLFTFSRGSALTPDSPLGRAINARSTIVRPHTPYPLTFALPVLAIAWVAIGALILPWRSRNRAWTRVLLICSGMTALGVVMLTHVGLVLALPRVYSLIQFNYRLEPYVLLELCGAILAALVLSRRARPRVRGWRWLAIPVCAVSLFGAIVQVTTYPDPGRDRSAALASYAEFHGAANDDYQDVSAPLISGRGLSTLDIPPSAIREDRATVSARASPGTLVATNIAAGAYLLDITGAQAVGIDSETDRMVLDVTAARISIAAGKSLPIALGRALSIASLLVLFLVVLVVPGWRALFRTGRRRAGPLPAPVTRGEHPADGWVP